MNKLRDLWNGELPLPDAFWNWAVIGGLIVNVFSSLLFLVFITLDQLVLALIAGYLPSVPYNFLVCVGVWRSAARFDGERQWADLARLVTVGGMLLLSFT